MKEMYISHSLIEGECVTESGEKISFDSIEGLVVYDRALM